MNLIICTSPLQVIIAERIVAEHTDEQFYGLMMPYEVNDKMTYYYHRLKQLCSAGSRMIVLSNRGGRIAGYLDVLKKIVFAYSLKAVSKVYVASFNIFQVQLILSAHSRAKVYTYDDGLINLDPKAWDLIMRDDDGLMNSLMQRYLHVPTSKELQDRSTIHYTIYKQPNVMPRTQYLSLFPKVEQEATDPQTTVCILLGQRIYLWQDDESNIQIARRVMDEFRIDYYLPHPKETYVVPRVQYLRTPMVFEDYILQELRDNPRTQYEIFLFCSTPALNLVDVSSRLLLTSIKPEDVPSVFDETYRLIAASGIPVISYPASR